MKKIESSLALSAAFLLAACGEDSTTEKIVEVAEHTTVVSDVSELPKCTKDNEGEQVFVMDESMIRICANGNWYATLGSGDENSESGFSCSTKELKDGSGLKIVCNGDSIGVVLNGAKGDKGDSGEKGDDGKQGIQGEKGADGTNGRNGKNGDDGASCAIVEQTDSSVVVNCGGQTMTLNLGSAAGRDSLELDSERIALSLDTLAGVSQKGPFLKGSTVYLYELSDGRTLKQTNGNFVSNITSDDGRFRFTARNLTSQYALIAVEGKYRNEVTGEPTTTSIRLQAYTDVLSRKNANVNLLTQLELNRVYYLVAQKKKRFKVAKHQAQMEIFNTFHIDTTGMDKSSEDLNVFGNTDADAALLAISVLLQGDSNETALSVLLTEIADDMESDGVWNDSAARARVADWAATVDTAGKLAKFRGHVKGWGLGSGEPPYFEKNFRIFWGNEQGLGVCGDENNPVGIVKNVSNPNSKKYYAKEYTDVTSVGGKTRFICVNADSAKWRPATNIEKDTMGWSHDYAEGDVKNGRVNSNLTYVYQSYNWRLGTNLDSLVGKGCVPSRRDTVASDSNNAWYICKSNAWQAAKNIEMDTALWGHDYAEGDVKNGRVNSNLTYVYQGGYWRSGTTIDSLIGKGCVPSRQDTVAKASNNTWYICKNKTWQAAKNIEMDTAMWGHDYVEGDVKNGRVNSNLTYVYQDGNWRLGTNLDNLLVKVAGGAACLNEGDTSKVKYSNVYYVCTANVDGAVRGWKIAPDIYNDTYEARSDCKKTGIYGDGTILLGRVNKNNKYVCDAGEFRVLNKVNELLLNRGCTSYIIGEYARVVGYYKCDSTGWNITTEQKYEGSLTDTRDHKQYKTIGIGTQLWMAENLNYETEHSFCYNDSVAYCNKYGRLYTWDAAIDSVKLATDDVNPRKCGYGKQCNLATPHQGVCPSGWHLPSKTEWEALVSIVGKRADALKSQTGWVGDGNGTDDFGFSALPAGIRNTDKKYVVEGHEINFWSVSEYNTGTAYYLYLYHSDAEVSVKNLYKYMAYSVRCLKDNP